MIAGSAAMKLRESKYPACSYSGEEISSLSAADILAAVLMVEKLRSPGEREITCAMKNPGVLVFI